jgi:hypothetical protein
MRITEKMLRAYLKSLNPEDSAGYRADPISCPAAMCLKSQGCVGVEVGTDIVRYSDPEQGTQVHGTPVWLQEFERSVDISGGRRTSISAKEALRILNKRKRRTYGER